MTLEIKIQGMAPGSTVKSSKEDPKSVMTLKPPRQGAACISHEQPLVGKFGCGALGSLEYSKTIFPEHSASPVVTHLQKPWLKLVGLGRRPSSSTQLIDSARRPIDPWTHRARDPPSHRTVDPSNHRTVDPPNHRPIEPSSHRAVDPSTHRPIEPSNRRPVEPSADPHSPQRAPRRPTRRTQQKPWLPPDHPAPPINLV